MPKVVDHKQFREEILERCFNIFSKKGYSNVSIREIADEAGVSTGTLYHYFNNKENILEELFLHIRRKNFARYRESVECVEKVDDRIKIITEFWKEQIEEYRNLVMLAIDYFRTKAPKKKNRVFHDFTNFYLHALSDTLAIPVKGSAMLFTYLIGLALCSQLIPGIIKPSEHISSLHDILRYLKNSDAHDVNGANRLMNFESFFQEGDS